MRPFPNSLSTKEAPTVEAQTLEAIAEHPLITYAERSNGKRRLMRAFGALGYTPKIIVSAGDEVVVKACVEEEGLGITILVSIVYDPKRDTGLGARCQFIT